MMKTYVFDNIFGIVARIEATSAVEAIALFERRYPGKSFACVYEE